MYCNIEIYNLGSTNLWELKNVMFDYLVFIFSFSSLAEMIFIFDSTNMVLFLFLFCVFSDWIETTHESPTCNLDLYIHLDNLDLYTNSDLCSNSLNLLVFKKQG